jgi:hypothetical protein
MRQHRFIAYRNYLYFKLSAALLAVATLAYLWHRPLGGPYGGTWLGYTLGVIAALIVLLLLWFGVRKRQYRNAEGTLLGWLSAHVYLGTTLVFLATLHTGFEFGWNVHTLSYVLMLAVVASGFYGVYAYLRFPTLLTQTLGEDTLDTLFLKIADRDQEARGIALQLPDAFNSLVLAANQETRIGGGLFRQLSGHQPDCPTDIAVARLQELGGTLGKVEAQLNRELYFIMVQKQALVRRARADVMYRARLKVWLYFHVPLAMAMFAALLAHVISVFFYW